MASEPQRPAPMRHRYALSKVRMVMILTNPKSQRGAPASETGHA